jgi:hypothetical protein
VDYGLDKKKEKKKKFPVHEKKLLFLAKYFGSSAPALWPKSYHRPELSAIK